MRSDENNRRQFRPLHHSVIGEKLPAGQELAACQRDCLALLKATVFAFNVELPMCIVAATTNASLLHNNNSLARAIQASKRARSHTQGKPRATLSFVWFRSSPGQPFACSILAN